MEGTKRCFKCGKIKPLDEFYRHSRMADGHLNKCKECAKKDVKSYRKENPEKQLETRLRMCNKNPTHENAVRAVSAAVSSGLLVCPDACQGCGRKKSEAVLNAHHHDYKKPLDVIWLCAACHRRVDRMRALVESGISLDEYRRESNSKNSFIRRAVKYYVEHVKTRNPIFDYERFLRYENDLLDFDGEL